MGRRNKSGDDNERKLEAPRREEVFGAYLIVIVISLRPFLMLFTSIVTVSP